MFRLMCGLIICVALAAMGGCASADEKIVNDFLSPQSQALAHAVISGDAQRIDELCRAGASVSALSQNGVSQLAVASRYDQLESIRALLRAGADPWQSLPPHNYLVPVLIVQNRKFDQLEVLLESSLDPNRLLPHSDVSLLHLAAIDGWQDGVRLLLDQGADMNFQPDGWESVASSAIFGGNYDIVLYLVSRGYRHDLDGLAMAVQSRKVSVEQEPHRKRVILWLQAQGVRYPPFPWDVDPLDTSTVEAMKNSRLYDE